MSRLCAAMLALAPYQPPRSASLGDNMPDPSIISESQIHPLPRFDEVIVRRASVEDAAEIAAQFHCTYPNSDHPFRTVADVTRFLEDPQNFQLLADCDGQILSSMAMTYYPWNDSYELGRALTLPEYRNRGLAWLLMQEVVDWVCRERQGEVFFGFSRVRRTVDLCSKLTPPMIITGHNGGRSVSNGSRETHLIVYSIPRHAHFLHVTPQAPEVRGSDYVQQFIYRPLGLCQSFGEYPPVSFVGEVSG